MRYLALLVVFVALAGCGSSTDIAKQASEQGNPCNAHTLEPKSAKYAEECGRQQHDEQTETEAHEAEKVLKQRHAEELANAAEGR
jgi:hypothetical protein